MLNKIAIYQRKFGTTRKIKQFGGEVVVHFFLLPLGKRQREMAGEWDKRK